MRNFTIALWWIVVAVSIILLLSAFMTDDVLIMKWTIVSLVVSAINLMGLNEKDE